MDFFFFEVFAVLRSSLALFVELAQALVDSLNKLIEKTIYEINRIGNNVNQIAYNTNSVYNTELVELEMTMSNLVRAYGIFLDSINEIRELCEYVSYSE